MHGTPAGYGALGNIPLAKSSDRCLIRNKVNYKYKNIISSSIFSTAFLDRYIKPMDKLPEYNAIADAAMVISKNGMNPVRWGMNPGVAVTAPSSAQL